MKHDEVEKIAREIVESNNTYDLLAKDDYESIMKLIDTNTENTIKAITKALQQKEDEIEKWKGIAFGYKRLLEAKDE